MMNKTLQQLLLIATIGLFSQFSVAQDANLLAGKKIADIVVSMNHFPSAADKETLAEISGDMGLAQVVRDMANAVSNIQHMPTADDKSAMEKIQGDTTLPEQATGLATAIANFSHMASADTKAELAKLFP